MSIKNNKNVVIHSAPWVLPIAAPALRYGSVAVRDGLIAAVGTTEEIKKAFQGSDEIAHSGVLMPALINAHMHLELSHLKGLRQPDNEGGICSWIEELLGARTHCDINEDEKRKLRQQVLLRQHRAGVVLIGDIGNDPDTFETTGEETPQVFHFREFIAPTKAVASDVIRLVEGLPDEESSTAHACYSTLPELIRFLKQRARRLGRVFSIHVAESAEEVQFIESLSGPFREFLVRRGAWDESFSRTLEKTDGVVEYLQRLAILDSGTLCVHCVHIKESEIEILAKSGSHVCLCPGSNRFLRVGTAPLERMLEGGILPAIGTDSPASNDEIDLWREMQILREEHPAVNPGIILSMATQGGAAALDCENSYGSLTTGRQAKFLAVQPEGEKDFDCERDVYDVLTRGGRPRYLDWIDC